jgi:hypothetical protein
MKADGMRDSHIRPAGGAFADGDGLHPATHPKGARRMTYAPRWRHDGWRDPPEADILAIEAPGTEAPLHY